LGTLRAVKPGFLRSKTVRIAALATVLAAGLLAAVPLATPATSSTSLAPTDDTFANGKQPNGALTYLLVDGRPVKRAYLRFTIGGLTQPVVRATLRLYPTTQGESVSVRSVTSAGWTESTLTSSNAPAPANAVTATSGAISTGTWVSLDVTPLVTGNGSFGFALTTTGQAVRFASKEAGAGTSPQLVVETSTPTTGSTSSPSTTVPTTTTAPTTTAPTTTTTPPPAGNPVIAVAGDIAGSGTGDSATAALLDALNPTAVLTAGDNAYENGSSSDYTNYYAPTWGRYKSSTFPTPGNHEYQTSGASGYFGYFGSRAGTAGKGFYSHNIGAWHLIALNSEIAHGATSEQVTWLKNDLAAASAQCVLAYWHKPRFTAGNYSDLSEFQPFWDALYAANADVVINGHDHNYQRYAPLTPSGVRDDARGLREFVVGTGGRSHYGIRADSRRQAADGGTYGVLKLTLRTAGYDWQFLPEAGKTFSDSGSASCH
jgi:hypothetical protein